MFRALWIKHWVQLRALRWVGFGLGIALPFIFWAGAEAAKRGWFGSRGGDYDLSSLIIDALPLGAAILWALLALMFSSQAFAGDRADGTERFLLDRPVPRGSTWLSRVLACLPSVLVIMVGHTAYIAALAMLVNEGTGTSIWTRVGTPLATGGGLAMLGIIGGMAAGAVVRNPMQAVLVGAVLTALPIGVTMFFVSVFQFVEIRGMHLAFLVTPIVPIALVVASYRASCHGEPAGRGRIKRCLAVVAAALVLTPALFAAAAPVVMRAFVVAGWPQHAAAEADVTVILAEPYHAHSGWMIDTGNRERIRFLKPPIRSLAWKADGSLLAVLHQAGVLGSVGDVRLELFDRSGSTRGAFDVETEESYAQDVVWAGDRILVREWLGIRRSAIRILDPERGTLGRIDVKGDGAQTWKLLGPTDDGSMFLHRLVGNDPRAYELNRLDLKEFRLEPPVLTERDDLPTYASKLISPSGRYLARVPWEDETYSSRVFDLQNGTRIDFKDSLIAGWLSGDRLVRLENDGDDVRVLVQRVDGEELLSRRFRRGVAVLVSPDGERFLVTRGLLTEARWFGRASFASVQGSGITAMLVCDGVSWTDLGSLIDGLDPQHLWLAWGGPNTLVASRESGNAVARTDGDASWVGVLGPWP